MKYPLLPILLFIALLNSFAQETKKHLPDSLKGYVRIDSIDISGNWMTWDMIIKNELLFTQGDWVRYGQIDTSINRIWNTGNFADVAYEISKGAEGNTLKIKAIDAVKFYPLFTIDHSSENDYNYRLGAGDDNFLGSNSKLKIVWEKNPNGVQWEFSLKFPRQLLYKNMTAELGYVNGSETKVFLERVITRSDGQKKASYNTLMIAPFQKKEYYVKLGNPWNRDYHYRFSPNLSLSWLRHEINYDLLSDGASVQDVLVPVQTYHFIDIGVSESIGTIDTKRHRKDGYNASLSYDFYAGMRNTKSFHTFIVNAEYHKILNDIVQLSAWVKNGYTNATDQYRFTKGSKDVIGIRTGEIFGKTYYAAYLGNHLTWINNKWFTLENAYFVNVGNGADTYAGLFKEDTKMALGTFLEMRCPMVPIVVLRFTFMYAGPGSEWFKFNLE